MTKKLFYGQSSLTAEAQVLKCEPCEEGFAVVLDQTIFFPQGGGQPCDTGCIEDSEVIKVYEEPSGEITHIVKDEVPLGPVTMKVDPVRRQLNTRLHSASHIISALIEREGKWGVTKGNSFPGQARLEFKKLTEEAEVPTPEEISDALENVISKNWPLLEKIDEKTGFRTVSWGDLIAYPCGGTHVPFTGGIGKIIITKCRFKKGGLHINFDAA